MRELLQQFGVWRLPIIACSVMVLCGCQPATVDPCSQFDNSLPPTLAMDVESPDVSQHNLRAWIQGLTSPTLEGRHAGEPGARAAAVWIAERMAELGLDSPTEAGFCRGFTLYDGKDYNVIGQLSSGSSASDRPVILVGAHYDGQGRHPAGKIYPGADDNASGVAALLEVARLAKRQHSSTEETAANVVNWTFVAFGGEEVGQLGARSFLTDTSVDLAQLQLAIHLDMVGRPLGPEAQDAIGYLTFSKDAEPISQELKRAATAAGVEIVSLKDFGTLTPMITDAEVFSHRLPTLLLSTALHEDHHRVSDTPDRLDYDQIQRASQLVLALAGIIADRS